MYMVKLKTLLTEAMKLTFDASYIEEDFRRLHISIEFPQENQDYPGMWVDYNPVGKLTKVGIGHIEYAEDGGEGTSRSFTRWRFAGEASFTVVALTSLERDRLHDEVIRVMAFGEETSSTQDFREYIENNEFLGVNLDFDEIGMRGFAATLGTPWQTNDMIYEAEIVMDCVGEFVTDEQTLTLIPLSEVKITSYDDKTSDPTTEVDGEWH